MAHEDEKRLKQADTNEPRPQPVSDAVGAIAGASAGAGAGVIGGPLGILVGAAAGALGGWWAGHRIGDALAEFKDDDYRSDHGGSDYDRARDYYRFGHVARANPDYAGRSFEEVEPHLRQAVSRDENTQFGRWDDVRNYVARGYNGK